MNTRIDKLVYRIVSKSGRIPQDKLNDLQQAAYTRNEPLADALLHTGLIKEHELLELYAEETKSVCVRIGDVQIDKTAVEKVPVKFAWYYKFFPVRLKEQKLTIAISSPFDVHTLDEIRFGLGYELETVFLKHGEIESLLKQYYGLGAETVDKILEQSAVSGASVPLAKEDEKEEDIEKLAEEASVIQLVNQIILEAYRKRASDIHIEPYRGKMRLRYRIDGKLQEARVSQEMNRFFSAIVSRFKILANLDIVERRLPQDGKARVKTQDEFLNLRVSSVPTPHGESVVVRILPTKMILSLEQLGFERSNLKRFRELIEYPHGIIFVTGPTGSGKSTTLYAGLNAVSSIEKKVITLEDPIEYEMDGMTQIQVHPEFGLTFAVGLRSVLRHDPDIMMVGEVRDLETADIAIRVALTGHLILSTLHTNDAASGVTRLLDIGVESYLVASSVIAFIAQRLVRRICLHCREEDQKIPVELVKVIQNSLRIDAKEVKTYRGKGCEECSFTGYSGRVAIHELLDVDEEIRKLIMNAADAQTIKESAQRRGMHTLRQDGWHKVLNGLTTPEEILQATPADSVGSAPIEESAAEITTVGEKVKSEKEGISAETKLSRPVQDRRKYVRVPLQAEVSYRPIQLEDQKNHPEKHEQNWKAAIRSEDISAGGIAFFIPEKIPVGEVLDLKILLPGTAIPFECIGRVRRVFDKTTSSENAQTYRLAVSFLAIHSADRLKIEQACHEVKS